MSLASRKLCDGDHELSVIVLRKKHLQKIIFYKLFQFQLVITNMPITGKLQFIAF